MAPLTTGIEQPFDSAVGVKRRTKIQGSAAGPVFPSLTQEECITTWLLTQSGVAAGGYGAYVQLIASTVRDSIWIALQFRPWALGFLNPNLEYGVDLALGAGGSEVPFWVAIAGGIQGAVLPPGAGTIPMIYGAHDIPSGSRVSVRVFDDEAAVRNYESLIQLFAR